MANELNFVVLSDIHIYTSGKIPAQAPKAILHIASMRPDLVLITGDHTNGNRNDTYNLNKVRSWYNSLNELLKPLIENNIPIIPVVGNHDFYRDVHQKAYTDWASKVIHRSFKQLNLKHTTNPLYFNFNIKNNDFFIFNLWTQRFGTKQLDWLKSIGPKASETHHRFGFGHVPLKSSMGKTSSYFYNQGSKIFNDLEIDIYFCGHEHLHWDEANSTFPNLRQIIIGTVSGTYNFPLRRDLVTEHCFNNNTCKMPYTGDLFNIEKNSNGSGAQVNKQNWMLVNVNGAEVKTTSYTLGIDGEVTNFFNKNLKALND